MGVETRPKFLKREIGLLGIFCVASGAMISSGLFVLPALAYAKAGPALLIAYAIASLLVIPAMLSKAELATAMPKAGGTYFLHGSPSHLKAHLPWLELAYSQFYLTLVLLRCR